jgi:hypothetical protein
VYVATGGPQGKGHVTLNILTNGGLTMVAVARYTGTAGSWERIIDLGSGQPSTQPMNNLNLARFDSTADLNSDFVTGASNIVICKATGVIVQDSWLTVVVRYRASTKEYEFNVNGGAVCAGTASAA